MSNSSSLEDLRVNLLRHLIDCGEKTPLLCFNKRRNQSQRRIVNLPLLLSTELRREKSIHRLASEMAAILAKHAPPSKSKFHNDHDNCLRAVKQLLPQCFVTFINSEWKRNEKVDVRSSPGRKRYRSWICPLIDAGKQITFRAGSTEMIDSNANSWVVRDALPSNDGHVLTQNTTSGSSVDSGLHLLNSFPLADVMLSEPTDFCRDVLIPSLEDEPAARCGSATLYSKFMFDFGINAADGSINKVMREVGLAATRIRNELHNNTERSNTTCASSSSSSLTIIKMYTKLIRIDKAQIDFSVKTAEGDDIIFSITTFQFIKLFILFMVNRRGGVAAADSEVGEIAATAAGCLEKVKSLLMIGVSVITISDVASSLYSSIDGWLNEQSGEELQRHQMTKTLINTFFYSVARCVQRYRNFDGGDDGTLGNLHAAIHPAFAMSLKADAELFANPFNTSSIHFCSLFGDNSGDDDDDDDDDDDSNTDSVFGSLGKCWDLFASYSPERRLLLEANPPFDPSVVQRLGVTISRLFSSGKDAEIDIVIIVPEPLKEVKHGDKNSKYGPAVAMLKDRVKCGCVLSEVIPARQAPYIRGLQQQQQQQVHNDNQSSSSVGELIFIQRDTAIIACSSSLQQELIEQVIRPSIAVWRSQAVENGTRRERE